MILQIIISNGILDLVTGVLAKISLGTEIWAKFRLGTGIWYPPSRPSLSGQTSIFNGVFFVFKSLLGIERQKKLKKIIIFDPKAWEKCQNIDISNLAKHRVMFAHVTLFFL